MLPDSGSFLGDRTKGELCYSASLEQVGNHVLEERSLETLLSDSSHHGKAAGAGKEQTSGGKIWAEIKDVARRALHVSG